MDDSEPQEERRNNVENTKSAGTKRKMRIDKHRKNVF